MHIKAYISKDKLQSARALVLMSHHNRNKPRKKSKGLNNTRQQSRFGSKSYRDALQKAFNRAKTQVFFNPDMRYFITLTYKGKEHTPDTVMYDVKQFIKKERRRTDAQLKYIYVLEYQKRGSIHVHMIANTSFTTHINKNKYKSLTNWRHGYSSVLHISNFDNNFKPYLYLFKYMRKAQRIGKSFLHSSRNLNNFDAVKDDEPFNITGYTTLTQTYSRANVDNNVLHFYRYYLQRDTIAVPIKNIIHRGKE